MHIYVTHILKLGMDQRGEKEGVVIHSNLIYTSICNSLPKVGNGSEKNKEGVVILSHFDKINVTHWLKLGMDQRKEKEGVVILSHFDKIYATHSLNLGMDKRRQKEGVVILIVILPCTSVQLTS